MSKAAFLDNRGNLFRYVTVNFKLGQPLMDMDGSFSKLRQFRLPYFASVYSAANKYKHCLEGTCDGLVSRPGESV